jgi:cyclophilin family peptidyl-prolyl cis-trans isomerase
MRRMTRWVATAAWCLAAIGGPALARQPAAAPAARAEFDDALGRMKKLMADLTVLQAQYQQPKADKAALEAKFEATKQEAMAAGERLEEAALGVLAVDPTDEGALEIAAAVVAGGLEADDPARALAAAETIAAAGAGTAEVALMAASAALVLSRPEAAAAWLERAGEAQVPADQMAQLQAALDRERPKIEAELARRQAEAEADDLPRVRLTTSAGELVVELFENEAANTVANFVSLVEKGFYDGTPFHRVIGGFMAQGGDPTGTGSGGPGHAIACECDQPGARLHFRGSLSMAHAGKDTGGSQFFLTFRPTDHLDGRHTVFGRVIEGDQVLSRLTRTQDPEGQPVPGVQPDTIRKAEVIRKRDHAYTPATLPKPRGR